MNTNEIINSGLLELYVLKQLTASEMSEISSLRLIQPEIDKEIRRIEYSFEFYGSQFKKDPPAIIKTKLLETITKDKSTKSKNLAPKPFALAAMLFLLTSIGLLFYLYDQLDSKKNQLKIEIRNSKLAQKELDRLKLEKSNYQSEIDIIKDSTYIMLALKGQDISPNALAIAYYNTVKKRCYINTDNLPTPTNGKQYQMWAIVEGKPVSMGMLDLKSRFHSVILPDNPQALAISLEKTGGVTSPTADQIYTMSTL